MALDNKKAMATAQKLLTTAASVAASMMVARTVINEFVPHEIRESFYSGIEILRARLSSEVTVVIPEKEGLTANQIFDAARNYLSTRVSPSVRRLRACKKDDDKQMVISLDPGEEMIDIFDGIEFRWQLICQEVQRNDSSDRYNMNMIMVSETLSFELTFHKKHKGTAFNTYLPYVMDRSKAIKEEAKTLRIFMNECERWVPINFHHPATFDTLAMDEELKEVVMNDLARFLKRKEYYQKIGKAWKRGYLLYGPPGTGKSSLIAAMANYLKFDIYDLELTAVTWNSELRDLLLATANKSILVVEDIDCSMDLQNRNAEQGPQTAPQDKVTLSGLLNFLDGLWSSCGEERIIIFTTNYKERLDAALLRPGRMDMHIYMGYCSPYAFKVLASNYHDLNDHPLFEEIEELIREVEVTPAEVAEALMRDEDAEKALKGLINFIQAKRKKAAECEANRECVNEATQEKENEAEGVIDADPF